MKTVQYMTVYGDDREIILDHYKDINSEDNEVDEGDLIIFRLLGAKFEYSAVVFKET